MDGVGSFGAGRAGSTIDPIAFAKQPQTILRALSWVSTSGVFFFLSPVLLSACVCQCVFGGGGGGGWWGVLSVVTAAESRDVFSLQI